MIHALIEILAKRPVAKRPEPLNLSDVSSHFKNWFISLVFKPYERTLKLRNLYSKHCKSTFFQLLGNTSTFIGCNG